MAEQGQGRGYACKLCGKSFASGRVLGGHVRSHRATTASKTVKNRRSPLRGDETEFAWSLVNECWVCGKGFQSRRALFGHMRLHPRSERGRDAFGVLPQECGQAFEALGSVDAHSRSRSQKPRIFNGTTTDKPQASSATASETWRPDEEEAAASLLILSMGVVAYRMKRKGVRHREDGGTKLKKVRYDDPDLGSGDNEVHIEMLPSGVEFEKVAEKGDAVYGGGEFEKGFDGALSFKLDGVVSETRVVAKLGHPDMREHSCKTTTFTAGSEKSDDSPRKREYKCKNCNRVFPSHQALGGHCAHPGKRGSSCSASPKDVGGIREASRGEGLASGKASRGRMSGAHLVEAVEAGGYAAKAKQDIPEKLEISVGLTRLIDLNMPLELQGRGGGGGDDGAHHLLKRCLVRAHEHGALVGPVV